MNILKTCLISLFLILSVQSANAAEATTNLTVGRFDANSKIERQEIAKDLIKQLELLSSYLPTLKPSEIEWLETEQLALKEIKDGGALGTRFIQLLSSPEYQHERLKSLLESIITNLKYITNDSITLKDEILNWAYVSYSLSDSGAFDDSIKILTNAGRLPADVAKKFFLSSNENITVEYDLFARGIDEFIVIPYLAGKITQ